MSKFNGYYELITFDKETGYIVDSVKLERINSEKLSEIFGFQKKDPDFIFETIVSKQHVSQLQKYTDIEIKLSEFDYQIGFVKE